MVNTNFTKHEALSSEASYNPAGLKGKSVVLTGGASGLGEEYMRAFVRNGAFVTFGDISEDRGTALVSELGSDNVAFVPCDVVAWKDQVKLFKTALDKSPSKTIDVVVANAGISGQDDVFLQEEDKDGEPVEPKLNILRTNIIGVFYTVKLALFHFPKQPEDAARDRCIVMTASLAAYLDHPGAPQYNASKLGVRGIMKSVRQTGPAQGIRINLIAPWFVATRIMSEQVQEKIKANGVEFCDISDAGQAVCHLASDKSINGRALAIVPRSAQERGYYDLQRDDWNEGDYMTEWMNIGRQSKARVGPE